MAIFGLARSGISALRFIALKTDHECFAVNSGKPENWESFKEVSEYLPRERCFDEEDASELFANMDLIIKSPGIPYTHPSLVKARENKVEIISEIEFAFRRSDIPVVAITGTNGKTTTATMCAQLLTDLGQKVFLGGNIGIPYSDLLLKEDKYDLAVVEVSSFQLENIRAFKPTVAILTNISPSHGERYDSHELYRDAKLKLFQNMGEGDLALVPSSLNKLNLPCPKLAVRGLDGFDFSSSKLVGSHNKENLFCAYQAALWMLKTLPGAKAQVDECLQKYIDAFTGVSYRIEYICSANGLDIYNDGKSTNMASTLAAIDSFPAKELYLIIGGKLRDRTMDFSELVTRKITKVYAFGEARDFIAENLAEKVELESFATLEELFARVKSEQPSGVLLFSPAFPSFDLYKNYEERAQAFNKLAREL